MRLFKKSCNININNTSVRELMLRWLNVFLTIFGRLHYFHFACHTDNRFNTLRT